MKRLKSAIIEEASKMFTAFVSWGIGICFMVLYCLFIYWLNRNYNIYVAMVGALVFLSVIFFFIDLWWGYNRRKLLG
ncbi:MAG: hypothetical protein RO469_04410 [Thermincola sp.]|jgi:hypothetical protein|nr:hypothetical protein [Thermincola sp.]MDT3704189.1 hypothetical protein [Thermincola sp.]